MDVSWYLAICHTCARLSGGRLREMPFTSPVERAAWVVAHHEETGHFITVHDVPTIT